MTSMQVKPQKLKKVKKKLKKVKKMKMDGGEKKRKQRAWLIARKLRYRFHPPRTGNTIGAFQVPPLSLESDGGKREAGEKPARPPPL